MFFEVFTSQLPRWFDSIVDIIVVLSFRQPLALHLWWDRTGLLACLKGVWLLFFRGDARKVCRVVARLVERSTCSAADDAWTYGLL